MFFLTRLWRRIFFSDVTPLIQLGASRPLQDEDFPDLPRLLNPRERVLEEGRIDWSNGRALLVTLMTSGRNLWLPQVCFYTLYALMNLAGPVLINLFVQQISVLTSPGASTSFGLAPALGLGVLVGLVGMLGGLAVQHYFYHHLVRFQVVTNVLNKKIFSHSLRLRKQARDKTPIGDIVNHMSADTDAVAEVGNGVADLYYCSLMLIGALTLMFYYLGSTAWVAILLLSVLAPFTKWVGRRFTEYDESLMRWRDERITLMSQILSAMRLVKYFVWERSVAQEVSQIREREIEARNRLARAELVVTLMYVSLGTLVLFSVLLVHVYLGNTLTAALVFTCVSLFSILEDPFSWVSRSISQLIAGKVAADRITRFLSLPVVSEDEVRSSFSGPNESVGLVLSFDGFSLKVAPGESLAIVGPVGGGKSTFLHLILGEAMESHGKVQFVNCDGVPIENVRVGYVPQESFILSGSIRENLLFGADSVSEEALQEAIQLVALDKDLSSLAGGLAAEIGEKGINLSGGQKQRMSLARAALQQPQLLLLDDPLSAVDVATERHLIENLIFGKWNSATRVVVTHRLAHLREFDRIVFIENGRIEHVGTWVELFQSSERFRRFIDGEGLSSSPKVEESIPVKAASVGSSNALRFNSEEDREKGAVHEGMYREYLEALAGGSFKSRWFVVGLLVIAAAGNTALPLLQKAWLAFVSNDQFKTFGELHSIFIYGFIGVLVMAGTLCADLFWLRRGLKAGKSIHDKMLGSVLGAKIGFFDTTPTGRILQRFSRDVEAVEIHLRWCFEHSVKCFSQVLITLAMIVAVVPAVLFFFVPIFIVYHRFQKLYRASAREAKRLDSISRSPRYAHFKETLTGLVSIRAAGKTDWFMEEFYQRLEHSQRMFRGHYLINRWFSSRIPVIGGLVAMVTTCLTAIAVNWGQIAPGTAGLLTVYSLSFWGVLNWGIRIWSEVEARMTSLERIRFYSNLAQEPLAIERDSLKELSSHVRDWPKGGEIEFRKVSARYDKNLPMVLKEVSFRVEGGTHVGIVGRTGSGKSTIFQLLYRLIEVTDGEICVDGIDISRIPLMQLRNAIAIIPQDPTLFIGSLRSNLDRYGNHSEQALWEVLELTALADFVRAQPKGLEMELTENGSNLSQGQRQLVCLARALLVRARIIVIDEATASVDVETDAVVQRVLRESCKGVTLLIIAHRLGTIEDCDQIIHLDQGRVQDVSEISWRGAISGKAEGVLI